MRFYLQLLEFGIKDIGIYKFDFFGTQICEISEIVKILYELLKVIKCFLKKTFMPYMV